MDECKTDNDLKKTFVELQTSWTCRRKVLNRARNLLTSIKTLQLKCSLCTHYRETGLQGAHCFCSVCQHQKFQSDTKAINYNSCQIKCNKVNNTITRQDIRLGSCSWMKMRMIKENSCPSYLVIWHCSNLQTCSSGGGPYPNFYNPLSPTSSLFLSSF